MGSPVFLSFRSPATEALLHQSTEGPPLKPGLNVCLVRSQGDREERRGPCHEERGEGLAPQDQGSRENGSPLPRKHLESIHPGDGGHADTSRFQEGFDRFRERGVTGLVKGSWGCLGLLPDRLRLQGWDASTLSQQASQTRQTTGRPGLTRRPTRLALLLRPESLASSPGDPGSDGDADAGLEAGAAQPVAPPTKGRECPCPWGWSYT